MKYKIQVVIRVGSLPEGLAARQDKADGHVTIYPTRDMTFEEYQEKLNDIAWKQGGSGG